MPRMFITDVPNTWTCWKLRAVRREVQIKHIGSCETPFLLDTSVFEDVTEAQPCDHGVVTLTEGFAARLGAETCSTFVQFCFYGYHLC